MTLDEAIRHAEEKAELHGSRWEYYKEHDMNEHITASCKCAEEHRQLAEWLKDYKRLKEQEPCEDAISRQAVLDMLEDINAETEGVGFYYEHYVDYIKSLPSVKPQESCDVPDTNDGDIISKQTVLDTISELNAISFYEAQEDSRETYYEIRQAIKDLSPVKQEPQTVIYSGDGYADGEMVYDMAECPNCGYEYENGDKDWGLPFCPSCGQKLNWESEDEE